MKEREERNRIRPVDPDRASGRTKQLFDQTQEELGAVPNVLRVLANAPVALEAYMSFRTILGGGSFEARVREQIALAVAESNLCGYCLSAHAFMGSRVGLSFDDIADAIRATAATGKTDGILKLARSIVVQRGEITNSDLERARASGLSDADVVETIANVVINIFTNYVNHVAKTVVDFPIIKPDAE